MPDFFLDEAFKRSNGDKLSEQTGNEDLSLKVNDIMEVIKKSLSSELVQNTQAVYQFNTNGAYSDPIFCSSIKSTYSLHFKFANFL